MLRLLVLTYVLPLVLLTACGSTSSTTSKCETDSTLGVVQAILDTRGCTASTCHGADDSEAAAGLDLRPENFYDNVVNVSASTADLALVFPADEERSVLYLKLAAKTLGTSLTEYGISGGSMPSSSDVLTEDELEVVRAWIRGGAPRVGAVAGAPSVLDCEADLEPSPNKIPPLPEPAADKGIQLFSGGWSLPADSEDEVCFVTYYDYSDRVPDSAKVPCPEAYGGASHDCFVYESMVLAQDPQSHHAIVESYIPPPGSDEQWDPKSDVWKNWQCLAGEKAGEPCDPTSAGECGEASVCATEPTTALGCIAYQNGPEEMGTLQGFFGRASTRQNIAVAQEATFLEDYPDGVYGVLPVEGFTIWNSHSFNLTKFDTTVSQYINFLYAATDDRRHLREDLTILDDIFAMGTVAPFTTHEACATFTMPMSSRLLTLSSHTHQYGTDFRIWYPPNDPCPSSGLGGPIDLCAVPDREPDYRSFFYQDPLYQRFNETNNLEILDSADDRDRTFRYCAIWDNGATDPAKVRRHSERPDAATCAFGEIAPEFVGPCGCAPELRACLGGPDQGMICGEDDSACGEGGVCDACPVWGGVTTEEEMFGILGAFYVND
ncbi:MAG: hypothetical protein E4H00_02040 [Myxococcales bacterium]|nr:MAG: hypothetical protein E4H00_02040 [Myxococcales bacterium]